MAASENKMVADKLLSEGMDNIHKAAAVLASGNVSPETAEELETAVRLIRQAKERERRKRINRLTVFSL